MKFLDEAGTTLRTTFRPRFELRVPRFFFDLRFVAAKLPQITQICTDESKTEPAIAQISRMVVGSPLRLPGSVTGAVALQ